MSELVLIQDTLDFAKDIAYDLEMREAAPSEYDIVSALQIMDAGIKGAGEDIRTMIALTRAIAIPSCPIDLSLYSDQELTDYEIGASVVRARIDSFEWLGSLMTTGFGIRLYGVDVSEPERKHIPTVFVPLEAVNLRLIA